MEVTSYAFLPLWAWATRRRLGELWPLAALAVFGIVWKVVVLTTVFQSGDKNAFTWLVILPAWMETFAAGMALAVLSVWRTTGATTRAGCRWSRNGRGCRGWWRCWCSSRSAPTAGRAVPRASCGFFLWHLAVIDKLQEGGVDDTLGVPLFTPLAPRGIAALTWYVIERPSLRLARRLTGPTAQTRTLADDRAAVAAEARPS